MKEEIQATSTQRSQRVDNRLTNLELSQKNATSEITTKLDIYTKKDDTHYNVMLTDLAQIEDLSIRVKNNGRRIEDLTATVTSEINKTTTIFNTKFDEVKTTLATTADTVTEFKASLRQVEANSGMIREMQHAMDTIQSRLNTLEAEKLSTLERFALQQARMDRIE